MSHRITRMARPAACAGLLFAAVAAGAPAAWAEYKISPGDVLNLTIVGVPDLTTRAPVDVDGVATLPLAGPVRVAGLNLADARAKLQTILPGKEYRRHTDDGREFPVIIAPSDINLSIAEYRPVYLNGDVAKPGEEPYRPGLTVRQAVALAGGYDILRFKMDNPFLQLSDLTSEYNSLWIDYAKQQALVARLQAELDGKPDLDGKLLTGLPIARSLSTEILDNERSQLAARDTDFAKERVYLRKASAKESERAQVLSEQQNKEQDGVKADMVDLQRYEDLFKKGALALPGLSEARRTVLLSSTRALQTTALLASVEREQGDLDRRLERVDDARRMQVLHDLQDANTQLAATRAKLQAVSDKLRYTGMVKSQLVRGSDSQPKIVIVRTTDGKRSEITAGVDTELEPGDVAEVALEAEVPIAASQ